MSCYATIVVVPATNKVDATQYLNAHNAITNSKPYGGGYDEACEQYPLYEIGSYSRNSTLGSVLLSYCTEDVKLFDRWQDVVDELNDNIKTYQTAIAKAEKSLSYAKQIEDIESLVDQIQECQTEITYLNQSLGVVYGLMNCGTTFYGLYWA